MNPQIICITMMALALAEDSLIKRQVCDEIIDELSRLPEKMRAFMQVGRRDDCVGVGGWGRAGGRACRAT
jgi:hypothetical protein